MRRSSTKKYSKNLLFVFIDRRFWIFGLKTILTTSAFIPQVYKIYKEKNADGISLTMYVILFIVGNWEIIIYIITCNVRI